ncbi:DEAD/DEAH box helicase [Candidatus Nanohalobium constans]|uniref:DNA 3'-5' helicase n=1 Tax=Candidatus Nanohalobium constans TaxID=2565781 RepID=A0A5Q0UG80_9ARCH|nr:DEAD/DEAH box helicase [Candidatus Nanohalobium constans]QGA80210.1 DNA excision repair protein ERCC-3 [Candidatus Nanohalobium constans]
MPEDENLEDLPRDELVDKIKNQVVFFEAQREIILSHPDSETLNEISSLSHMETSSGEHYKFEVREMDVWNSDRSLEEMKEIYTRVVGSYPRFVEWLERTYKKQEMFSIEHRGRYHSLVAEEPERMEWARSLDKVRSNLSVDLSDTESRIAMGSKARAEIKQVLLKKGYPVEDNSKFRETDEKIGADMADEIELRDYQKEYVEKAHDKKAAVLANPAGSGKTVTAIGLMAKVDSPTLILVPQRNLVGQWKREILDKTTLTEDQIGEYHGDTKEMNDVTIATYHMAGEKTNLFRDEWGLIIFDEVHHIPSKLFRKTASLQSTRRIGLSASPVREDTKERDIFALIGQEIGSDWARFFAEGHVVKPDVEIQLVEWASDHYRHKYEEASGIKKAIIASKNPAKKQNFEQIIDKHEDEKTIIFCDWLDQGEDLSQEYDLPFISGETDFEEREEYFEKFRNDELKTIIVSRIGDEGLDLPDAEIGIVMSGQGGSRRQATQRAGRVMRPFGDAQVYMVATKGSNEEDFVKQQVELLKEKGVPVTVSE